MKKVALFTLLLCTTATHLFSQNKVDVIFLTDHYEAYLQKANSSADQQELYTSTVQLPIYSTYFKTSQYAPFVFEELASETVNNEKLTSQVKQIKSNKAKIQELIEKSFEKCTTSIPLDQLSIYVIPPKSELNFMSDTMSGVFGLTAGENAILLSIDPTINGWEKMLSYAVAHEYYHAYWTKQNYHKITGWNILDFMCFEGRADYFAKQLFPKVRTPWTETLSKQEEKELWESLLPELTNQDFEFLLQVMFGSDNYPKWGGYALGYTITNNALQKENTLSISEWTTKQPIELLALTDFQTD
ncbi:DUF2268 domain-containing putative Zn-dependent protease [Aquimarina brevivitae]|uniref:Uncharacterized protein YjaZ n=1 Tax=Aquimarina brevivitae TaxID=323412 RepID=A0A4Q7PF37_9FLAO|nr:DUF2268 domain-containing putative Zn-dependent protease [Aquimarina brevivitae]RZS99061.1 uncharacterized protein YjaZ [Aquimarina brevivitae]